VKVGGWEAGKLRSLEDKKVVRFVTGKLGLEIPGE